VTGCLKNIAYGDFSNVARSHEREISNTYSFIGTLASVEPLRSRTVLNVMDGLRSVWHGGPFLQNSRYLFFPKRIVVGTDPVALDHLLIDMIEEKRRQEGAPSIFDRSRKHLPSVPKLDPNFNLFIREPGHVEYASSLPLSYSRLCFGTKGRKRSTFYVKLKSVIFAPRRGWLSLGRECPGYRSTLSILSSLYEC
jgi:Domain of unknown function (DUF362)